MCCLVQLAKKWLENKETSNEKQNILENYIKPPSGFENIGENFFTPENISKVDVTENVQLNETQDLEVAQKCKKKNDLHRNIYV